MIHKYPQKSPKNDSKKPPTKNVPCKNRPATTFLFATLAFVFLLSYNYACLWQLKINQVTRKSRLTKFHTFPKAVLN
jgi:hypothetical protein